MRIAPQLAVIMLMLVATSSYGDVTFNLIPDQGMDPKAVAGFSTAAQLWSQVLSDNITVNLKIGFTNLGSNILGQSSAASSTFGYSQYRAALASKESSVQDIQAVASLTTANSFNVLLNGTTTNSANHVVAENLIVMTAANAKAIGLLSAQNAGIDASITFNSAFNFEFNRANVAGSANYDFIGIAAHEIGHALGFVSGVDLLDTNFNTQTDAFWNGFVTPLDMFRMSTRVSGGTIDWTADTQDKYFSIDQGATSLGSFSTGVVHGDTRQASHWKDQVLTLGIMDPTVAPGEVLAINGRDMLAMDVIGYTVVPEPSAFILLGVGGITLSLFLRRSHL